MHVMSKACERVCACVYVFSGSQQALVSSTAESAVKVVNLQLDSSTAFTQQGNWSTVMLADKAVKECAAKRLTIGNAENNAKASSLLHITLFLYFVLMWNILFVYSEFFWVWTKY